MVVGLSLLAAALLSGLLIVVLKPVLIRYALARPNARSSHKVPTPQGGGIAVLAATVAVTMAALPFLSAGFPEIAVVLLAAIAFGVVGAADDIRPLPAWLRLVIQFVVVSLVVSGPGIRLLPEGVPLVLERAVLVVGGVWFVNLVNFMDGLDGITVAEMVPVTAFLAGLGLTGFLPLPAAILAGALCGALLGFAPFNRPVARLFLGDVGSLSIGLLAGWLLLVLARHGTLAAALLLPLYYLVDATLTLLRRLALREKVWEAHRSHFYQRATDNGFSALSVSAHVFGLNLVLAGLAAMTLLWPSGAVQAAALALGLCLVGLVLRRFSLQRPEVSR